MLEMSKSVVPPHMGDTEPCQYIDKICKLGKLITDVAAHKLGKVTVEDPEYWGLAEIVTEEMADVALTMKVRKHYTFDDLCKMNNITEAKKEDFKKLVDEMNYIGLLEYDFGNHYDHNGRTAPQSERRYTLPMFVPGSAELMNMEEKIAGVPSNDRLNAHPALASFFERMTYLPLVGITQMVPPGGSGIGMHVIPVEQAIGMENQSVDLEHLSYWLKKYEGHIGVGQCSCRVSRAALGEGCGDDEMNWCIGVGDFADYSRETGKGHDITYEEAMRILQKAEDNGFVHQITNIDGENKIFGICNCNVNICNALRTSQMFNTPNMSRSAYTARVEKDKCVACGKCVEYCPAGAVKLGQKLCTKDGDVKYPKVVLPDNVSWGPEKYDVDYRDNNRKNCYETGTAPCKAACPAHIAVQGYVQMAKEGKYQDALALIKKDNPFPAICGRVCNKRCEAACTRGTVDEAVAIDDIKKFIAEQDLHAETRYIPEVVIPSNRLEHFEQKIAIIGGGPAGLSCAFYLATKGYKPTVFEKSARPGGMLTYGIPSYKLEKDVVEAEIDVLRELGVEIKCNTEVGKDVTLAGLREDGYKAFYVAIGCQGGKIPPIPGTDATNGIDIAVNFLHKASEDQQQKMDGGVVVVGGGNVAVDCIRTAYRFGGSNPQMFCLESREEMPASDDEIRETLEEGIAINNSWGPKEVLKDEAGNVSGIVFKKCTSVKDADGRFNPQYDENDTMTVECKNIVFAIGQGIEWGTMLEGEGVEFWHGNYPVADPLTYQTAQPDIFVGGDVYSGPKFAIDAIEAGKNAAVSLHRFVQPGCSMTIGRNRRDFIELDKENIVLNAYDEAGRQEPAMDPSIDHKHSFRDAHKTLTAEQVHTEASRCLSCGASVVDENKCIGCGVCTTKCAFDAIQLHRTHPECTKMIPAEDKFKGIGKYQAARAMRIAFGSKTPEEKAAQREHKEYKKNK